jgi:hypothetical protein
MSVSQAVTKSPSQSRSFDAQHVPRTHDSPIGHALPHAPQLFASLFKSRQMSKLIGVPVTEDAVHMTGLKPGVTLQSPVHRSFIGTGQAVAPVAQAHADRKSESQRV